MWLMVVMSGIAAKTVKCESRTVLLPRLTKKLPEPLSGLLPRKGECHGSNVFERPSR